METDKVNCQNCEQPYKSGYRFCPHCGQKTNDDLTIGVLFYNTISNYFSFDARFFKSFIPLMFKPGFLAKEFIRGKRLLYLHPAQMYLFVAVIFFFIFNFYVRDGRKELDKNMEFVLANRMEKQHKNDSLMTTDSLEIGPVLDSIKDNNEALGLTEKEIKELDSITGIKLPKQNFNSTFNFNEKSIDSLIEIGASDKEIYKKMGMPDDAGFLTRKMFAQGLKFYKTMGLGQIYQTFIDSIPLAMFFLLPLFALLLKLFFYNKGRYAHHLVFSFYYFSFVFTILSIVFAVNRWLMDIPDWIDGLLIVSVFIYLLVAILKYYRQHWLLSIIKSSLVSFLFLLIVLPSALTILIFIAFLFY